MFLDNLTTDISWRFRNRSTLQNIQGVWNTDGGYVAWRQQTTRLQKNIPEMANNTPVK